jgi:hypothetical protein
MDLIKIFNIQKIQIKTALRFHFTPVRIVIIKKTENNKCWQRCSREKNLYILLKGMYISPAIMEISIEVAQEIFG